MAEGVKDCTSTEGSVILRDSVVYRLIRTSSLRVFYSGTLQELRRKDRGEMAG